MKIYCKGCYLYLGEIKDAKLRKKITYLCENCETKRLASDMKKSNENPYEDLFGDLFKR